MWKLLQRFRNLDADAQSLFVRGFLLLPLIAAGVRLCGFRRTRAILALFLSAPSNARPAFKDAAEGVSRTVRMTSAAARYGPMRSACLEKSLALWWLLGRQGIASNVRIGTRKCAARLEAHAWVEWNGAAPNEVDEPRDHFSAFDPAFPVLSRK
jgi:hypothetical protein